MAKIHFMIFTVVFKFSITYAEVGVPKDTTQIHDAKYIVVGKFIMENDTVTFHISKYIKGDSIKNNMFYINEKSGICPKYMLGGGIFNSDHDTFIKSFKQSLWMNKTVILLGSYTNTLWKNDNYEYSIWPYKKSSVLLGEENADLDRTILFLEKTITNKH